jgi:hypothetical protein
MRRSRGGRTATLVLMLVVAGTLSWAAWGAAAPGVAQARPAYVHGGIADCETCHVNAHTWWTPTNEHCYDCHPGFQVRDSRLTCWTCHAPGEDMSAARPDAACTQTCHLFGGQTLTHVTHTGGAAACTSCHAVTGSPADSAGGAHHTVPVPRLADVAPAHGLPGTQVSLTGNGFTGATLVSFGGMPAVFKVDDDTHISAVVPAAAVTGSVVVITRGGRTSVAEPYVVTQVSSLTLRASRALVRTGRPVSLTGLLRPAGPDDQVTMTLQRRSAGVWRTVRTAGRVVTPQGTYSWSFRTSRRGSYRACASLAGSPAATAALTPWAAFRIR